MTKNIKYKYKDLIDKGDLEIFNENPFYWGSIFIADNHFYSAAYYYIERHNKWEDVFYKDVYLQCQKVQIKSPQEFIKLPENVITIALNRELITEQDITLHSKWCGELDYSIFKSHSVIEWFVKTYKRFPNNITLTTSEDYNLLVGTRERFLISGYSFHALSLLFTIIDNGIDVDVSNLFHNKFIEYLAFNIKNFKGNIPWDYKTTQGTILERCLNYNPNIIEGGFSLDL